MQIWAVLYTLSAQLLILDSYCSCVFVLRNNNTTTIQHNTTSDGVDVPKGEETLAKTTPDDLNRKVDTRIANSNPEDSKDVFDSDEALNNTDIRAELPALLPLYCPGADVCRDDKLEGVSEKGNSSSCCRACSCSNDCQISGNCCFPSPGIENNEIKHSSCYSTLYPAGDDSEELGYKSYMMVDSEILHSSMATINSTCGETEVAPWGSLYPVYSKSHQKIYKNSVCAAAYDVNDGVLWMVHVACRKMVAISRNNALTNSLRESHCDVWFEFPGDASAVDRHMCFFNLVSVCPETFSVSTSLPRDQLLAACESGLLSPYRDKYRQLHRNVFCSICNGRFGTCADEEFNARSKRPYTALLDESVFAEFKKPSPSTPAEEACLFQADRVIEDTCRPVLCPLGQIYTAGGRCEFLYKTWYKPRFVVHLQLVPDDDIDVTDLTINSFQSPWLRRWTLSKIYYFPSLTTTPVITDKIFVELLRVYESVNTKHFMRSIKKLKTSEWTVKTPNGSKTFKADFKDALDDYYLYADKRNNEMREEINATRNLTVVYKSGIIVGAYAIVQYTTIGHEAFCEQVDLSADEFRIHNRVLFNNLTSEYLLPAEHYFADVSDFTSVRICIETSGLTRVRNGSHGPVVTVYVMLAIVFISHCISRFRFCNFL